MSIGLSNTVKCFDKPFAYVVFTYQADSYCSYCLRKPPNNLLSCAQCRFARYCGKNCQKAAWKDHKAECARLKNVFPNLPTSEVFLLAKIIDKLNYIREKGDINEWQKDRKFEDLESHEADIRADEEQMKHFEKLYEKTQRFMGDNLPSKEELFLIFCRAWINSHTIHTNAGIEIGMALDLGVSRYNHSCRPNITMLFEGFSTIMRPLTINVDSSDPNKAFFAYIDVGRSKYQRRKELQAKWYFLCQCDRCMDPQDDRLTSIKCSNSSCKEAIIITEDCVAVEKICPTCSSVITPETVTQAQTLMKNLPTKFAYVKDDEELKRMQHFIAIVEQLLHPENIYYCRLQTAYMQLTGGREVATKPEIQKMVYENYKRCLPNADRQFGFQLLHLVKSLIEQARRSEAVPYAYEAMTVFEICFGLHHPVYLQTLALWTFLETKARKSDEELISLMNFNVNSPVDITPYLEKAQALRS